MPAKKRRGRPPQRRSPTPKRKPKKQPSPSLETVVREHNSRVEMLLEQSREALRNVQAKIPDLMAGRRSFAAWRREIPPNSAIVCELAPEAPSLIVDRVLVLPSHHGVTVESITVDGVEQLGAPGVPAEFFAAADPDPAQFDSGFGPGDRIALRNATAETVTVSVSLKGVIEPDRARADRLARMVHEQRLELEALRRAVATLRNDRALLGQAVERQAAAINNGTPAHAE